MAMKLLTTNTSSNAASSSFTSSIDSTYKLYIFKFYDVNPATNAQVFHFNGSTDGGSNYNLTKTTTWFDAGHAENDSVAALAYVDTLDLAQSTGFQPLGSDVASDADASLAGELHLFNPSSTTYVKHFYAQTHYMHDINLAANAFQAGYFNTTSDIDAVQFKMSSGNMDAVIKMYGVG
jgi:hypothetical protein